MKPVLSGPHIKRTLGYTLFSVSKAFFFSKATITTLFPSETLYFHPRRTTSKVIPLPCLQRGGGGGDYKWGGDEVYVGVTGGIVRLQ